MLSCTHTVPTTVEFGLELGEGGMSTVFGARDRFLVRELQTPRYLGRPERGRRENIAVASRRTPRQADTELIGGRTLGRGAVPELSQKLNAEERTDVWAFARRPQLREVRPATRAPDVGWRPVFGDLPELRPTDRGRLVDPDPEKLAPAASQTGVLEVVDPVEPVENPKPGKPIGPLGFRWDRRGVVRPRVAIGGAVEIPRGAFLSKRGLP